METTNQQYVTLIKCMASFNRQLMYIQWFSLFKELIKNYFIIQSRYSCTNVLDLTKAEMEGREQAMNALIALKTVVPGFEKAKLRNFGMTIGTRDSRKIVGR